MGTGTVLTLLGQPNERRDHGLSKAACDAVMAAITSDASSPVHPGPSSAATALKASLDLTTGLTSGERHLLAELLDRIADGAR